MGERERDGKAVKDVDCNIARFCSLCTILQCSVLFSTFRITLRIWTLNGGRALTEVKHGKYLTVRSQKNLQNKEEAKGERRTEDN